LPRLYRILWSLVILFLIVTTVIFSFGMLVVGAAVASLYGLYRYYFGKNKKGSGPFILTFKTRTHTPPPHSQSQSHNPRGYTSGEVIDMPVETLDRPLEPPKN
jgi:hypothetical protein